MKLIIDIPDLTYDATLEREQLAICNDNDIYKWIKNGIPLEQIMQDIEKALEEPQYLHNDEDWGCGLIMAEDIIYKYMGDKQ